MEKINPKKWYRPSEIVKNRWIKGMRTQTEKSIYFFILQEIKRNRLEAENYAHEDSKMKYFRVKGQWILDYIEKY